MPTDTHTYNKPPLSLSLSRSAISRQVHVCMIVRTVARTWTRARAPQKPQWAKKQQMNKSPERKTSTIQHRANNVLDVLVMDFGKFILNLDCFFLLFTSFHHSYSLHFADSNCFFVVFFFSISLCKLWFRFSSLVWVSELRANERAIACVFSKPTSWADEHETRIYCFGACVCYFFLSVVV